LSKEKVEGYHECCLEENGILVKVDYFTEIKCNQITAFINCLFLQHLALGHHQSKLLLLINENVKDYFIPSRKNSRKKSNSWKNNPN